MRLRFAGRFDHTQQKILNPPPQQAALRSKPPDLTICNLLFCATHSLPSSEHSSCGRRLQTAHRAVCLTPRRGATTERSDTFVGGRRGHSPLVRLCLLSPQCESKSPLGETLFIFGRGKPRPYRHGAGFAGRWGRCPLQKYTKCVTRSAARRGGGMRLHRRRKGCLRMAQIYMPIFVRKCPCAVDFAC